VLVTGAAGFIGSHLVDRLLADGFEVIGLDNLMTGDLANLEGASRDRHFHLEIGDVRDPLPVYPELIFNMACPASPVHYQSDPHATFTASVLGALRLVEHARGRKCRIVHASTSEVYGDPLEHPQREDYFGNVNPIGPRACYDEGKRAAETIFMDARRTRGMDVRIARVFNTYGPRMATNDGRAVSTFVWQCLTRQPITMYGDGRQTRSFCYIADLLEGLMAMARVADLDGPVNLGNPAEVTLIDLANVVMAAVGEPVEIVHMPLPVDDPKRRRPDITRARTLLGFAPHVPLPEGIRQTVDDFRLRLG
jgi:UDP-glucuronate decarboxylase